MMHAHDFPRPMADDWRNHAACKGLDAGIFYPPRHGDSPKHVARAKAICDGCPARDACLEDAMAPPFETDGIRGGLTFDERKLLRRRRNYAAKRADA